LTCLINLPYPKPLTMTDSHGSRYDVWKQQIEEKEEWIAHQKKLYNKAIKKKNQKAPEVEWDEKVRCKPIPRRKRTDSSEEEDKDERSDGEDVEQIDQQSKSDDAPDPSTTTPQYSAYRMGKFKKAVKADLVAHPTTKFVMNPMTGRTLTRFGRSYWQMLEFLFGKRHRLFKQEVEAYKTRKHK
jgi:hypothetical protein